MNSRERFLAVLAGEMPDRVPIVPVIDGFFAPKVIGRANDECFAAGACLAEALTAARREFGYDGAVAEMGLGPHPSVLGCPVEIEGNDVPLVVEAIVGGRDDLERLVMPDPWSGGKMEPVERLVEDAAGSYAVIGSVRAPFEYAATVRGLIEFMTDFYRDPGLVRDLIEAVRPATIAVGKALIKAGVDALVVKDSFASSSMISPEHYREFAFPSERKAIAELAEDIPVILHICRNSMPILADMARTGAAALEIDSPIDLAAAKAAVGRKVALKGNIDAVSVIEKGSACDVEEAVRAAIAAAGDGGGFILSSGDSIPLSTPPENIAALVEYGRKYGAY
ncbi:MAG: uroporphyrinogen decarboxylase family protein [Actinobacteria bacterium]|nr:uroporphyrinogen decarboxylase family protein [Actinomycetota bacterium]